MDAIFSNSNSLLGLLGTIGLGLVSILAQKYVVPFLETGRNRHYAEYIAQLADDITDDLRARYPEKGWTQHLDEAVDQLISITGVDHTVARRVVNAAAARK